MSVTTSQIAKSLLFAVMHGFFAASLFVRATESVTPTRFWGFLFSGLYVAALGVFAVIFFLTETETTRLQKRAKISSRQRARRVSAWLLLAVIVAVTFLLLGIAGDSPLVANLLLGANIVTLVTWLFLLRRVGNNGATTLDE